MQVNSIQSQTLLPTLSTRADDQLGQDPTRSTETGPTTPILTGPESTKPTLAAPTAPTHAANTTNATGGRSISG